MSLPIDYAEVLGALKQRIHDAQLAALRAVNCDL